MADEPRRQTLKIIGAIGVSCMFPYQADELYGQHVHEEGQAAPLPTPRVFKEREMAMIARVTDLIIPATETPGAVGAGVPYYIDYVASANKDLLKELRTGLAWLRRKRFLSIGEERQIAMLEDLSRGAEAGSKEPPYRFWRAIKSMTADGYYTSKIGLRDELGYAGNTVRDQFPESHLAEH